MQDVRACTFQERPRFRLGALLRVLSAVAANMTRMSPLDQAIARLATTVIGKPTHVVTAAIDELCDRLNEHQPDPRTNPLSITPGTIRPTDIHMAMRRAAQQR